MTGFGLGVAVNEAWKRFASANALGSQHFAVGQNYLEVSERAHGECSEEAAAAAAGIRAVLTGERRDFSLEYPCHSETERRWFRLMVTPVAEGGTEGAVVMHVNVTERRAMEEELRASEERYRTTFEQAAIGIASISLEGRFMQVNDKLCTILGYSLQPSSRISAGRDRIARSPSPQHAEPASTQYPHDFKPHVATASV